MAYTEAELNAPPVYGTDTEEKKLVLSVDTSKKANAVTVILPEGIYAGSG